MRLASSRVHFIGIGGIGMCGLAELLHNMGARVSGSDQSENAQTQRLRKMGVRVDIGHKAVQVEDVEVVVYSSAVRPNNEEFKEARRLQIPLIARAEALAEIMRLKRGVAIGGTHGKTTTTSLAASIFMEASLDPTIVVGGRLDKIKSTAQLGKGEWLIAEADESDGSFARLSPEVAVITNVDNDHLDHYRSFTHLQAAFYDFASRIPFYGLAVVCGDDPEVRKLFAPFPKRMVFYGFNDDNDYVLKGERGEYTVMHQAQAVVKLSMPLPGRHNALNALAAGIVAHSAGIPWEVSARAISQFAGVDRRFQHKGERNGVDFYDDYGHHPTEVRAVLAAFREKFPQRRVLVCFQPHRHSRTKECWADFLTAFGDAHRLFLLDIYGAGEEPIAGVTSEAMSEQITSPVSRYMKSRDELLETLRDELVEGDVLVTLGAGDIWKLGEQLMNEW